MVDCERKRSKEGEVQKSKVEMQKSKFQAVPADGDFAEAAGAMGYLLFQ